jgi:hypothetical protein
MLDGVLYYSPTASGLSLLSLSLSYPDSDEVNDEESKTKLKQKTSVEGRG